MAAPNYNVNYDDERFAQVEQDKNQALSEMEETYDGIIDQTDQFYNDQIDASKQWAEQQSQIQQEKSDFAIEQIEQQKDQAHKDYVKEQSGSYADWQKQSNRYGAEAERQASAGLTGTGFSESSQVAMYNQYQNRVATAREVFSRAVLNYDNAIKDARIQNNAVLAEIAANAHKEQLELALQGFQYKNDLILEQANKKIEVDNMYYNRWLDVLNQINTENAMAEDVRQFEKNYELQSRQLDESIRQFEKNYELQVREFNESIRQFNEEIARLKKKDEQEYQLEIQQLEMQKQQMEQEQRQWEAEMQLERDRLNEEKRQFNEQHSSSGRSGGSSGGSSGGGRTGGGGSTINKNKTTVTGATKNATNKVLETLRNTPVNVAMSYLKSTKAFKDIDNPLKWLTGKK